MAKTTKSVEAKIANRVNGWLNAYGLDYKLENESPNTEIEKALNEYYSKAGGKGGGTDQTHSYY